MTTQEEYQRALKNLEALTEQERQLERYKDYLRHESRNNDHLLNAIKNERLALAERLRSFRLNLKIDKRNLEQWTKQNQGDAINGTLLGVQQR